MDVQQFLQNYEHSDLLRILTAGSVDDGKSTLIGRLLFDSKGIYEDHLAAMKRDSVRRGAASGNVDYSLITDGLRAEREQGITIDVAYRYFSTPKRKFIIADTPGHEQYTRNMATGASTADLAVLLIDARHGVLAQTKRHSFIASLLGIKHLLVAVNKMDLVGWDQDVFSAIKEEFVDFATKLQVTDLHVMPISALEGDGVVTLGDNMPWYHGGPLLDYLETVHVASDRNFIDLRFPVQYVVRPNVDFRGYCGTVASGILRRGDEVMVLPSGLRSRVKSIVTYDGELEEAFPPLAVTVTLEDDIDVSRGDMLIHPNNMPRVETGFEAMLVWMDEEPLEIRGEYFLKQTTKVAPGRVRKLIYRMNINTMHREKEAHTLELNEIGRVAIELNRPLYCESYASNKATGSFVVVDRLTNRTVGAGMIISRRANLLLPTEESEEQPPKSAFVHEQPSLVTSALRSERMKQEPVTVWLTGLPKAGKSTIAYALEERLFDLGYTVLVIDGENMRLGVSRDLDFSGEGRWENVRRAAGVARICCDAGLITIAAFVSPYESNRARARKIVGASRFIEVFVKAPPDVCEARDVDGLYEKARSGEILHFSGVSAPYEAPTSPDLVLSTEKTDVEEAVSLVVKLLEKRGLLLG